MISPISAPASRFASRWRPCSCSSVNTGTKAAESAASATRLRKRFGIWNAMTKALIGPLIPNRAAAAISRTSPATRLTAVHIAKMAVDRPKLLAGEGASSPVASISARAGPFA